MVGYNTDTHRDERRECLLVTAPKRGGLLAGRAGNCTRDRVTASCATDGDLCVVSRLRLTGFTGSLWFA